MSARYHKSMRNDHDGSLFIDLGIFAPPSMPLYKSTGFCTCGLKVSKRVCDTHSVHFQERPTYLLVDIIF